MSFRTDGETADYWQGSPVSRKRTWANLDSPDPDAFSQNLTDASTKNVIRKKKRRRQSKSRSSRKNYIGRARERSA